MDMDAKVYELPVFDDDLIDHTAHLPEVIRCKCGYVRAEADVPVLVTATL